MGCRRETFTFDDTVCFPTTVTTQLYTTTSTRTPVFLPYQCENPDYFGLYCNMSNDICELLKPCENQGVCYSNKSLPIQYWCDCPDDFSGDHCENDDRVCKNNTCWHDGSCVEVNSTISINNKTTFQCVCEHGYDGTNCELMSDMCVNITCENQGICLSSYLSWTCQCLGSSLYSGKYCETKSAELIAKQALSKSFAFIAIIAIVIVVLFVIIMDILKYVFKIDPTLRDKQLIALERKKKHLRGLKRHRRKKAIKKIFYIG